MSAYVWSWAIMTLAAGTLCRAGDPESCLLPRRDAAVAAPTGNARIDFSVAPHSAFIAVDSSLNASIESRKSPFLAAGLSFVLPGAGEFYSGSYLKSAVILAAEATLWALAYTYDQKGNHQTDYFQGFANAHWSVVNYAQYALDHYAPAGGNYHPVIPGTEGYPPWMRVNWAELNRMESDIGATSAGSYYSHQLPEYNTQQYYELIGKYPQFNQGWDDAPPSFSYGQQLSAKLLYYSGQRGQANTYYTTASTFVAIAVVNHVVSAVDAALTAGSFNRGLHASAGSLMIPAGRGSMTLPALCLRYGL